MAQTKRRIKKGMDAFLPSQEETSDNKTSQTKHAGGRPPRQEKLGPTQKATFRIPVSSVQSLERTWLRVRQQTGKKITKSALLGLALDEMMPRVENGEFLDKLEDYLG